MSGNDDLLRSFLQSLSPDQLAQFYAASGRAVPAPEAAPEAPPVATPTVEVPTVRAKASSRKAATSPSVGKRVRKSKGGAVPNEPAPVTFQLADDDDAPMVVEVINVVSDTTDVEDVPQNSDWSVKDVSDLDVANVKASKEALRSRGGAGTHISDTVVDPISGQIVKRTEEEKQREKRARKLATQALNRVRVREKKTVKQADKATVDRETAQARRSKPLYESDINSDFEVVRRVRFKGDHLNATGGYDIQNSERQLPVLHVRPTEQEIYAAHHRAPIVRTSRLARMHPIYVESRDRGPIAPPFEATDDEADDEASQASADDLVFEAEYVPNRTFSFARRPRHR